MKPNKIYQGDCLKRFSKIDSGSIDLLFADPPFNIGYEYDVYDDHQSSKEYLKWCREWMGESHRVLKDDGTFWLAIGDEFAAELKIEAQKIGFHCRSWVVWYYTFGVNCVNGFSRSHTHLFHFVKNQQQFTFNRVNPQIRVKSARQLVYADNRANPNGRLPDNTWIIRPQDAPHAFSPNHDLWYFARVAGTFKEREGFHGCQMPEQLLARIIRSSSNPQDLVLDPFAGSGTTLSVAKKLGRRWIGFELSKDYVKFIKQRMQETSVGDPIDGPEDPIESAPSTSKGKRRKNTFDEKTEKAVVSAFKKAGRGFPVDYILCDQELNHEFVDACLDKGIGGNAFVWNRYLLSMRKKGKLPGSKKQPPKISTEQMDLHGFASEVAWRLLAIDYRKTLDDILCSPDFSSEFDRLAILYGSSADPDCLLSRRIALSIRKRSKVARQTAVESFSSWIEGETKRDQINVGEGLDELQQPGVFVLKANETSVYVGESQNMESRVQEILENENWQKLEIDQIQYISHSGSFAEKYALKSALVMRDRPLLNCRLLMDESEFSHSS